MSAITTRPLTASPEAMPSTETFKDRCRRSGLNKYGLSALLATVGARSYTDLSGRALAKATDAISTPDDEPDRDAALGFNVNGFVAWATDGIQAAPRGRQRHAALREAVRLAGESFQGDALEAITDALSRAASAWALQA